MLKKRTYILILGVTASLFSCSEASTESDPTVEIETPKEAVIEQTDSENPETITEDEAISSRYHYDEDWEVFKTAVINKDIKGVSAFASSDNIDAEILIDAFKDPDFLAALKKATYDDLEVDSSGDDVFLVFSCAIEGSDEEGNVYESGLYLYFTQGETGLLLENFLAAG